MIPFRTLRLRPLEHIDNHKRCVKKREKEQCEDFGEVGFAFGNGLDAVADKIVVEKTQRAFSQHSLKVHFNLLIGINT